MVALLISALFIGACGQAEPASNGAKVVATTSIWGDVATEIVGEEGLVEVLVPRGSDAHDYQATPRQVASLGEADLVIANGLGLEEGLEDVLESARQDGANILELAPELNPLPFADHDSEHEHGDLDPHIWFDPGRVGAAAMMIATALAEVDPDVDWASRARSYSDELLRLSEEMTRTLDAVGDADRKLVTNHEALGYFADTFDFEVVGVVVPGGSTLGEPSSAELAELVSVIDSEQVDAIFTETSQPDQLARAVALEAGREVSVVELFTESLGEAGSPADTLIGMLLVNATRIADALG